MLGGGGVREARTGEDDEAHSWFEPLYLGRQVVDKEAKFPKRNFTLPACVSQGECCARRPAGRASAATVLRSFKDKRSMPALP